MLQDASTEISLYERRARLCQAHRRLPNYWLVSVLLVGLLASCSASRSTSQSTRPSQENAACHQIKASAAIGRLPKAMSGLFDAKSAPRARSSVRVALEDLRTASSAGPPELLKVVTKTSTALQPLLHSRQPTAAQVAEVQRSLTALGTTLESLCPLSLHR